MLLARLPSAFLESLSRVSTVIVCSVPMPLCYLLIPFLLQPVITSYVPALPLSYVVNNLESMRSPKYPHAM